MLSVWCVCVIGLWHRDLHEEKMLLLVPLLFWLPGYSTMSGPSAVSGPKGGSLTVRCSYDSGWEHFYKWWCRGARWNSCRILVKTTGSEKEVKNDRVSIRDSHKERTFTVTMEKLREEDAGFYWCGIEKTGIDRGVQVKVSIDPAPTTTQSTTISTTTFTTQATSEETTGFPAMTSQHSYVRPKIMELQILIPLVITLLLLLLTAVSLLAWRMVTQKKKAAETSSEQMIQTLDGGVCYAHLTLQHSGTSPDSSWIKTSTKSASSVQANQAEVEYVTMAPIQRKDIPYASLTLDTSNQEPTYSNMSQLMVHIPPGNYEEPTEYSCIRRS